MRWPISVMEGGRAGSKDPWGDWGKENVRLVGERAVLCCLGDCEGGGAGRLTVLERWEPAGLPVVSEGGRELAERAARRSVGIGGHL